MFRALMNVRPSHLADPELFDFAGLAAALGDASNAMQLSAEH
jgi:tRNA 2-thiocytidine biosynthesis protein TtcA